MDGWQKIIRQPMHSLIHVTVFVAMLAMPWLNRTHLATFLLIATGVLLVFNGDIRLSYRWLLRQWLFIAFAIYYLLQVLAYILFPEKLNRAALDEKAPLLFVPVLLYVLIMSHKGIWATIVKGFISANIIAALACLINACYLYSQSHDKELFFYHTYAAPTGMGAIYLSLFLIISLIYVLKYGIAGNKPRSWQIWAYGAIAIFLYGTLLLLSSKMLIVTGTLLLLISLYRMLGSPRVRLIISIASIICLIGIFVTNNPISRRYKDIKLDEYAPVFTLTDFNNYPFDGLNLRLLLWRMGSEITNEQHAWLAGNGGKHYQQLLDERVRQYHLYTGVPQTQNYGYLHYNMHNQYMESYVQYGMAGLATILFITLYLIFYTFKKKQHTLNLMSLLSAAIFTTESVLERQSGILLITLIFSLEWIQIQQNKAYVPTI